MMMRVVLACALVLAPQGCGGDGGGSAPDAADTGAGAMPDAAPALASVAQTPPRGGPTVRDWLAAGHYKSWKCEPTIMNARPNGAHGRNRVCSNDLASRHASGPYPVGAASVKELYGEGASISQYAVSLKVKAGTDDDAWYWYEGSFDGVAVPLCAGCHRQAAARAGNDNVYVQVR